MTHLLFFFSAPIFLHQAYCTFLPRNSSIFFLKCSCIKTGQIGWFSALFFRQRRIRWSWIQGQGRFKRGWGIHHLGGFFKPLPSVPCGMSLVEFMHFYDNSRTGRWQAKHECPQVIVKRPRWRPERCVESSSHVFMSLTSTYCEFTIVNSSSLLPQRTRIIES